MDVCSSAGSSLSSLTPVAVSGETPICMTSFRSCSPASRLSLCLREAEEGLRRPPHFGVSLWRVSLCSLNASFPTRPTLPPPRWQSQIRSAGRLPSQRRRPHSPHSADSVGQHNSLRNQRQQRLTRLSLGLYSKSTADGERTTAGDAAAAPRHRRRQPTGDEREENDEHNTDAASQHSSAPHSVLPCSIRSSAVTVSAVCEGQAVLSSLSLSRHVSRYDGRAESRLRLSRRPSSASQQTTAGGQRTPQQQQLQGASAVQHSSSTSSSSSSSSRVQ